MRILILTFLAVILFGEDVRAQAKHDDEVIRMTELSVEDVEEIQGLLYDHNFNVWNIDGKWGPETEGAVKALQARYGHKVTGRLTRKELEILKTVPPPSVWSSLSASPDGSWGAVLKQNSRKASEKLAEATCQKKSDAPSTCITMSATNDSWLAAVTCKTPSQDILSIARHYASDGAVDHARLNLNQKYGYPLKAGNCKVLATVNTEFGIFPDGAE